MTDPMRQILLGFDARAAIEASPTDWSPERREQYLLRRDVRRPLSVDEAVWTRRDSALGADGTEGLEVQIATPKWTSLAAALAGTPAAGTAETIVAITVWQGLSEPAMSPRGEVIPPALDEAWEPLGWDVVDGLFPSALTNCAYREDDRRAWQAEWEGMLNEHHLFRELPAAFGFRDARARDVPALKALVVMGLYRVR